MQRCLHQNGSKSDVATEHKIEEKTEYLVFHGKAFSLFTTEL